MKNQFNGEIANQVFVWVSVFLCREVDMHLPIIRMGVDENRLCSSTVIGVKADNELAKLLLH